MTAAEAFELVIEWSAPILLGAIVIGMVVGIVRGRE